MCALCLRCVSDGTRMLNEFKKLKREADTYGVDLTDIEVLACVARLCVLQAEAKAAEHAPHDDYAHLSAPPVTA